MIVRPKRLKFASLFAVAALSLAGCIVPYSEPMPTDRPVPPPPPPPSRPPISVDVGYFYDSLDPYGDWLYIEPYGWVWAPNAVDPFWRPYTVGRWVWTDWGWTWASNERWGWATYHYGRWARAPRHGWVWIPGTEWGPAWVAWRQGGGAVGWAPLPPEVRFRAGIGLDWGNVSIDIAIHQDWWCFVDGGRFDQPDLVRWAYPVGRNATVIRQTRDATRVRVVERRIVNDGIGREEIERVTRRAIPAHRIVDAPAAADRGSEIVGGEARFYRPEVREARPGVEPRRGRRPEPEARPAPEVRPAPQPRPATPSARPAPPRSDPESEAERQWDRKWLEDWRKLEREQANDERKAVAAPKPPDPKERLEQIRSENRDAAENAAREQQAARERAKRQAERGVPGRGAKKAGKKDDKKDDKKDENR